MVKPRGKISQLAWGPALNETPDVVLLQQEIQIICLYMSLLLPGLLLMVHSEVHLLIAQAFSQLHEMMSTSQSQKNSLPG